MTLHFTSVAHFNTMIDGTAQPIPLASPAGSSFLTGPFTRLADLMGTYLKPSEADLEDPTFAPHQPS